tara:strand:+ start:1209 stop:1334 length:126 start_codon:yes stop_codon:yes gene_type:complete
MIEFWMLCAPIYRRFKKIVPKKKELRKVEPVNKTKKNGFYA